MITWDGPKLTSIYGNQPPKVSGKLRTYVLKLDALTHHTWLQSTAEKTVTDYPMQLKMPNLPGPFNTVEASWTLGTVQKATM